MKFVREPILHFLLLGGLVFGLHSLRNRGERNTSLPRIEIGATVIENLRAGYEKQFGKAPGEEELRDLVTAHLREEVYYREALSLGLDRDDTIVRRRLAQKMEFLSSGITEEEVPGAAELEAYFGGRVDRYSRPGTTTFRHVYFSREKRGDGKGPRDAADGLASLRTGEDENRLGDGFLHGFEFSGQSAEAVGALFGASFAEALAALPSGEWAGPVESEYGWHLVKIEARGAPVPLEFTEARSQVVRDWIEESRRRADDKLFQRLRDQYVIAIDEEALQRSAIPKTAQR